MAKELNYCNFTNSQGMGLIRKVNSENIELNVQTLRKYEIKSHNFWKFILKISNLQTIAREELINKRKCREGLEIVDAQKNKGKEKGKSRWSQRHTKNADEATSSGFFRRRPGFSREWI